MLKNYLKVFWRNVRREKLYFFTVIFGLSTAFTACLLIFLYVYDEHTYDEFHADADRIVRVGFVRSNAGTLFRDYYTPPEAEPLFTSLPEVAALTRLRKIDPVIRHRDNMFQETEVVFATESFFEVFKYEFLEGTPETALADKYAIVLTQNRAARYFGSETALGKTLILNREGTYVEQPFIVTGVIEDLPQNTSFNYDVILSHQSMRGHLVGDLSEEWGASFFLHEANTTFEDIAAKLPIVNTAYFEGLGQTEIPDGQGFLVQPITDVHLDPPLDREWIPGGGGGNLSYLIILISIGGGLLLIALVNYVNLTTARSLGKARNLGIRKALGAYREQIVAQQFVDSFLVCTISMLIALAFVFPGVVLLNQFASRSISYTYVANAPFLLGVIIVIGLIGLLAGSYPCYYVLRFNAIDGIKNRDASGREKGRLRNLLIVAQYALSAILIVFALHVYLQLNHIRTRDLGFEKESLIVLDRAERLGSEQEAFLQQIRSQSFVLGAGVARTFPGRTWGSWKDAFYERRADVPAINATTDAEFFDPYVYLANDGFATSMDLDIIAGRNFYPGHRPDSASILVNETAVQAYGWDEPVGEQLHRREFKSYLDENNELQYYNYVKTFTVVGVIEDFHYLSLENPIEPLFVLTELSDVALHCIIVRTSAGAQVQALETLEEAWNAFMPQSPFVYYFVEQELDSLYAHHTRFGWLVGFFTLLSLIVAAIGMLGLASFMVHKRVKEIGVRKILGASIREIMIMLSRDAMRWVVIACIISLPLAYWITLSWLENFAYRIDLKFWVVSLAVLLSIGLALLSINIQIVRAAFANPVESLRQE